MKRPNWRVSHSAGKRRVVVTQALPGDRWLAILAAADCRVEIGSAPAALAHDDLLTAIGARCDGVIGQVTERWGAELFGALAAAGGRVYSNYAVGVDNLDLAAATRCGVAVGNTPGVLTEATAEMAVALTFAAARRLGEAERFLRAGRFDGWRPTLLLGNLLERKTLGVVGPGRIGSAYARMMVAGHRMNLIYHGRQPNAPLEAYVDAFNRFLAAQGEAPVACRFAATLEELLAAADCVSLHTGLTAATRHLMNAERLAVMKPDALLVNTSRGPVIDERALIAHCRRHPAFRVGLDVFEGEPRLDPALAALDNVVVVPHLGSATATTREGMATLAAANVAGVLSGAPVWPHADIGPFLGDRPPAAAPSILNAAQLQLPVFER